MLTNKLKRKRVGLIVWGIILISLSLAFFLSAISTFIQEGQNMEGAIAAISMIIIGLFALAGGIVMLIAGILNATKVSRYNRQVLEEEKRYYYSGICPFCQRTVNCEYADFNPHKRYPEGFIYCPICRKPISRNAFQQILK